MLQQGKDRVLAVIFGLTVLGLTLLIMFITKYDANLQSDGDKSKISFLMGGQMMILGSIGIYYTKAFYRMMFRVFTSKTREVGRIERIFDKLQAGFFSAFVAIYSAMFIMLGFISIGQWVTFWLTRA